MPSNNTGKIVRELYKKYPDKIAALISPDGWREPYGRFAIDNGCYKHFDENKFFKVLDKITNPLFVVAPDCLGCHDRTLALWNYYYQRLKSYGYQLAFVAQDGCEPHMVPKEAGWIFVGGTDPWKMNNVKKFINDRPVHVGRVNGIGRLRYCESIGVTSVDGTGWLRQRSKQFYDLMEYFQGEKQCYLF
jgi:hypothetical protein